jgi:hypothetical protein
MHDAIARYVAAERRAARKGNWLSAGTYALQVYRACALYGYARNPYTYA